ncbi:MAG: ammonium transporter [bacterium]
MTAAPGVPLSSGDTAWVLMSTAMVMLMVPGLALFYGGLVRGKNALNTMMMTVAPLGIVTVQWIVIGYSLAFAPGNGVIGSLAWWGFETVGATANATYAATVPHIAFALFQAMFACITVSLISGAVVERMRFSAYLLFSLAWTTLVYDPLAHWVWGDGGWLRTLGALDFAGGTVVHVSAGTAALVAALVLGRRRVLGRAPLVPHSVPFTLFGAGLLWFGWFGFNAGSALSASDLAAMAFATTHAAAAAGFAMWILIDIARTGRATAVGAATGAVIGLVAITPAAGFVTARAALVIGALAALASYAAMQLRARTQADDTLDVFACHGIAGIVGALLTGVFATKAVNAAGADGLFSGGGFHQVGVQALAVLVTVVLSGTLTAGILLALRAVMGVSASISDEVTGLDTSEHGEEAYHAGDLGEMGGSAGALGHGVVLIRPGVARTERRAS